MFSFLLVALTIGMFVSFFVLLTDVDSLTRRVIFGLFVLLLIVLLFTRI